jgi:hypothetical protein
MKTASRVVLLLLLTGSFHVLSQNVSAQCACPAVVRTPESEYRSASAVFVGVVTDILVSESSPDIVSVRFTVQEAFKGVSGSEVVVQTGSTPEKCGVNFIKGESFLVYAFGPSLQTNLCSRTRKTSAAGEDLAYLRGLIEKAVIREDFSQSSSNFEVIKGGRWYVSNGRYLLTNARSCSDINGNISVHKTVVSGDFTLETEAAAKPSTSAWNDVSILFNYQDGVNYYFASFNESNDGKTNGIFRIKDGQLVELVNFGSTTTASTDTLHKIVIERKGTTINVTRDGVLLGTAADATFSGGRVGYGTRNDEATFDNLKVTQ